MSLAALHPRTRFALTAFASLLVFLVAGVFTADGVVAFTRPLADAGAQILGIAGSVDPDGKQGWTMPAGERFRPVLVGAKLDTTAQLEAQTLRLMLRGFPLFLALMVASPWSGKTPVQVLKGLALLTLIYLISLLAVMNHLMAQSVERMGETLRQLPPAAIISAPKLNPASYFIIRLLNYLSLYVLPLISPVAIWAWLRPDAVRLLLKPAEKSEVAPGG